MVTGGPGSGKSTLAKRLGEITGLPVPHMDHIHHLAGWPPRPTAKKSASHDAVVAGEAWIFEGGPSAGCESRAARADLNLRLDHALPRRLLRVSQRTLRPYGRTRPDVPAVCPERFRREAERFVGEVAS